MNLSRIVNRQLLVLKKQSPHILFGAGVAGAVTSTVLACRATLKLSGTLEEIQTDMKSLEKARLILERDPQTYSRNDYVKDVSIVYTKSGLQIVKLYAPAVVIGAASLACLTKSHIQLTQRNTALMAAYAAIDKAYNDYRKRVRDEVGEAKELDLYRSANTQVIKNELDKKETVRSVDPNSWSAYAKFFDEGSSHWEKDPELNRLFVQCQQNYANNLLHARGHLFLNEVYDMLDVPRTKAGAVVGWTIGSDGDNFVDFGMFEAHSTRVREFVNGNERSIILDFNVDGVILDKI